MFDSLGLNCFSSNGSSFFLMRAAAAKYRDCLVLRNSVSFSQVLSQFAPRTSSKDE